MPRKKDPPPSTLPPRRSTRGVSKSTSFTAGEEAEALVVPLVGLGDNQESFSRSLLPPLLKSGMNMCNINKESSIVPSVSVSLDESEQGLGLIKKDDFLKDPNVAGNSLPGKSGFVGPSTGLSESDSSGSPGFQGLHTGGGMNSSPVNETARVGYAVTDSPATPLFSPEFKASWGYDYLSMRTGLSLYVPLNGEATSRCGLSDGTTPNPTVSERERVSQSPEVHVHVPGLGLETELEVQGIDENQLVPGAESEPGIHVSVGVDEGVNSTEVHGHVPDGGLEPSAVVHGLHVAKVINLPMGTALEERVHAVENLVHGDGVEVPLQPHEVVEEVHGCDGPVRADRSGDSVSVGAGENMNKPDNGKKKE
ncbi:hypothetical protein L1987_20879 [Smallanthus sonchifolius]|uniref:Uncharacterized protein n=1 Tax=Smallanthus sonchifolius TaxID=185202 RepID=A0ACB9ISU1_9ASTR|nr:hypothetical protein L1987_20879 [Smallanthus sonchifolius]